MSNAAGAQAALDDANAIIARLGLDGDGLADPTKLASQIEANADEIEGDLDPDTNDKADSTAQADSSTATGTESDKGGAKADGSSKAAEGEQQPAGVLLKDGKHFLPYDKHVEERRARVAAENRVKELEAQLSANAGGKGAGTDTGTDGNGTQAATGSLDADLQMVADLEAKANAYREEGLTELADNTAAQAKVMRTLMERVQKFGGYVEKLEARERQESERAQLSTQEQIASAIENNPTLRYLNDHREKNPELAEVWDEIAAEDEVLRTLPKYAGKSFADRFAAAVRRVEADRGPIKLPAEYQTVAQVRADAEKKTANAGGEFRPHTLSDLPGGGTPRGADDNPFDAMDPTQLERLMDDPKKMSEILSRAAAF